MVRACFYFISSLSATFHDFNYVCRFYRKKDTRTWGARLRASQQNWAQVLPTMVDMFLESRSNDAAPSTSFPDPSPSSAESPERDTTFDFTIDVVDLYTLRRSVRVRPDASMKSAASALVGAGYIGTTPLHPSLAISIKTLELYRRLRLRKPSFSVECFAKVICDLYMVCSVVAFLPRLHD